MSQFSPFHWVAIWFDFHLQNSSSTGTQTLTVTAPLCQISYSTCNLNLSYNFIHFPADFRTTFVVTNINLICFLTKKSFRFKKSFKYYYENRFTTCFLYTKCINKYPFIWYQNTECMIQYPFIRYQSTECMNQYPFIIYRY